MMTFVPRIIAVLLVCLATGLFFASGSMASTTENECIIGGGHVADGQGCRFCVGGKYDLSEIRETGKSAAARTDAGQKPDSRNPAQSRTKPPADH